MANALPMLATCMTLQVAEVIAYPMLGTSRPDPDPVNHETIGAVSDRGIEGHDATLTGLDDARVPAAPSDPGGSDG